MDEDFPSGLLGIRHASNLQVWELGIDQIDNVVD